MVLFIENALHTHQIFNANKVQTQSNEEKSPVAAWINSTLVISTGRVKDPVDEREPLTHRIADLSRENDKQHLSHPITAEYCSVHLSDKREARCL